MTQTQQPEALRLAEQCDNFDKRAPIAACLRAQHARIQELELNLTHRQEVYTASLEQIVCLQDRIAELEQGKCLHQIAEPAEQSATYGMHFGDRVLHIGGRENAAGYIEFGSVEAVRVLVGQVLRDLPGGAPGFELAATHPTQQGLDAQELLAALGDLSFACFGGIGTKAPDAATYNRTFAVFQKHRDAAQAKQGGV